eukprot:5312427-Alexandrium_andersonii.AAC.1
MEGSGRAVFESPGCQIGWALAREWQIIARVAEIVDWSSRFRFATSDPLNSHIRRQIRNLRGRCRR